MEKKVDSVKKYISETFPCKRLGLPRTTTTLKKQSCRIYNTIVPIVAIIVA